MPTIAGLWIYPIKSLGGVAVERAEVLPEGSLRWDREWLVVDEGGAMLWQGDLPRMTLLRVGLDGATLTVARPGGAALSVDVGHGGEAREVTQYRNRFDGTDAGEGAAAFLSGFLGRSVRLVRIGAGAHRWPKVNPLHVLSEASIAALNARLAAKGEPAKDVQRFRPNVLLAGAAPFGEEAAPALDFGAATLHLREPATRCELVNISLVDGSEEREPLRTIAGLSRERATARRGSFGVYCRATGSHLAVGMTAA